jgi:fibronectin type 3 domain-containing protein
MKQLSQIIAVVLLTSLAGFANTPGKHTVALSWTAPASGCTAGCTYNVYRSTSANACSGTPTPYATGISSPAYTDQNVTLGQTYFYDVSAVGSGGESTCSNEVQVSVPTPPSAPTGLAGTVQ